MLLSSEEDEEPFLIPEPFHSGRYIVCIDPLDGSSNIDVVTQRLVLSSEMFQRNVTGRDVQHQTSDYLRSGRDMVGVRGTSSMVPERYWS